MKKISVAIFMDFVSLRYTVIVLVSINIMLCYVMLCYGLQQGLRDLDHNSLINKLVYYGAVLEWFTSYPTDRTQYAFSNCLLVSDRAPS